MSRLNNRPANRIKREEKRRVRGDYNNLSKILDVLDRVNAFELLDQQDKAKHATDEAELRLNKRIEGELFLEKNPFHAAQEYSDRLTREFEKDSFTRFEGRNPLSLIQEIKAEIKQKQVADSLLDNDARHIR